MSIGHQVHQPPVIIPDRHIALERALVHARAASRLLTGVSGADPDSGPTPYVPQEAQREGAVAHAETARAWAAIYDILTQRRGVL